MSRLGLFFVSFILLLLAQLACDQPVKPDESQNIYEDKDIYQFSAEEKPVNIQYLDSYSGDGVIHLYWTTGRPMIDFPIIDPVEIPEVAKVVLYISTEGPEAGFTQIIERNRDGSDSTTVENLANGKIYFFRLGAYDSTGSRIGVSKPLMTNPGPPADVLLDLPARQTEDPYFMSGIAWSPNGDEIAFVRSGQTWGADIHIYSFQTKELTQLTHYGEGDHRLLGIAWSPAGNHLAYDYTPSRTFYQLDYRIWLIPRNGSEADAVSVTSGRIDFDPVFYTEQELIFCKGTYEPPNIPEIYRISLLTPQKETPVTNDQTMRKYSPSIRSSDGMIIFAGSGALYQIALAGGAPEPLTETTYWSEIQPSWGSENDEVLFASDRCGHYELWSMNTTTGSFRQVTRGLEKGARRLQGKASPDGTKIAYFDITNSILSATLRVIPCE